MAASRVYSLSTFRGINLASKPEDLEVGECVDCMNVYFDRQGEVVRRGGLRFFGVPDKTGSGVTTYGRGWVAGKIADIDGGTLRGETVLLWTESGLTTLRMISPSYTGALYGERPVLATTMSTHAGAFPLSASSTGGYVTGATDEKKIVCAPGKLVKIVDIPTLGVSDAGAGYPKPVTVATMPVVNVGVAAGFLGATDGPSAAVSSGSHVYFSADNDLSAWDTTDSQQCAPGDGETICASAVWGGNVFLFKQSKFFVFGGRTLDSNQVRNFDYQTVEAGVGCDWYNSAIAMPDGVYFVGKKGVYRTTGGRPECVSEKISPFFTGFVGTDNSLFNDIKVEVMQINENAYNVTPTAASIGNNVRIYNVEERLYVTDEITGYTFCYDTAVGSWTLLNYTGRFQLDIDSVYGSGFGLRRGMVGFAADGRHYFYCYDEISGKILFEDRFSWGDAIDTVTNSRMGQPVASWWKGGKIDTPGGADTFIKSGQLSGEGSKIFLNVNTDNTDEIVGDHKELSSFRQTDESSPFIGRVDDVNANEISFVTGGEGRVMQLSFGSVLLSSPWRVKNVKLFGTPPKNEELASSYV